MSETLKCYEELRTRHYTEERPLYLIVGLESVTGPTVTFNETSTGSYSV